MPPTLPNELSLGDDLGRGTKNGERANWNSSNRSNRNVELKKFQTKSNWDAVNEGRALARSRAWVITQLGEPTHPDENATNTREILRYETTGCAGSVTLNILDYEEKRLARSDNTFNPPSGDCFEHWDSLSRK